MRHRRLRWPPRRAETGATLVEFALVAPVAFMLIFGIIAGSFLVYQNSALHDGASAGARMASIETSLVKPTVVGGTTLYCESGMPISIEKAVAQAAPLLTVNTAPLCSTSPTPAQLTQAPVNGEVNIIVTCGGPGGSAGTCDSPASTQLSLTFRTRGIAAPIGLTYNMTASSQDPVLGF